MIEIKTSKDTKSYVREDQINEVVFLKERVYGDVHGAKIRLRTTWAVLDYWEGKDVKEGEKVLKTLLTQLEGKEVKVSKGKK